MNISFRCNKCKRELKVDTQTSPNLQDIIYSITPCDNTNCYDCKNCEEMVKSVNAEEKFDTLKKDMIITFTSLELDMGNMVKELEDDNFGEDSKKEVKVKKGQTNLDGKNIPKI